MKTMILALAVLFTSMSSFAAGGAIPYGAMSCRIPGMADGGFYVLVSAGGGAAPYAYAKLVEDTIMGGSLVGNYTVSVNLTPSHDVVYADVGTRGQLFKLVVHGKPMIGAPAPAILRSNSKAGRFVEKLACQPLLQRR